MYLNNSSIKSIKIKKLFNRYNYNFDFKHSINIFVDENGSGKTTILNIINNILNRRFKELYDMPFENIEVIFSNGKKVEINKNEKNDRDFYYLYKEEIIERLYSLNFLPLEDIFKIEKLLFNADFKTKIHIDTFDFIMNKVFKNSLIKEEVKKSVYLEACNNRIYLHSSKPRRLGNSKEIQVNLIKKLREEIKETVLYFPTYRRIEKDYTFNFENNDNIEINFGMKDVEKIIQNLTNKLRDEIVKYYSTMNNKILEEMLTFNKEELICQQREIDQNKLEILINRIGKDNAALLTKVQEKLKDQKSDTDSLFLKFYILKLIDVYDSQKEVEDRIRNYVTVCNKYFNHKKMNYNEESLKVSITNEFDEEISLQNLSSGEKQLVSILTKVYLMEYDKIILIIDEPELSLSIKWQETLLKDLYDSKNISLLIATTHSPFIFNNEFFKFSKSLTNCKEM